MERKPRRLRFLERTAEMFDLPADGIAGVPRLELVEYLWDQEIHIDDNTLSVNIMRIREKLEALGKSGLIQTKRGMGYKI